MAKSVDMEVLRVYDYSYVSGNEVGYRAVRVKVAGIEIGAYINSEMDVSEGTLIRSNSYTLTDDETGFQEVMLLIQDCNTISKKDYRESTTLEVKLRGKVKKPDNRSIKFVGEDKKPFYSCTMKADNNRGGHLTILLVSFFRTAEDLSKVGNNCDVTLYGKVRKCKFAKGYEINVTELQVSQKEGEVKC